MQRLRDFFLLALLLAWCEFAPTRRAAFAADNATATHVKQVIKTHCVKCHERDKQEGDFRLDDLSTDESQDMARWNLVHEQLRGGLMPPEEEPRIAREKLTTVLEWLSQRASKQRLPLPNQGNLISHELLFGKAATGNAAAPARVWRLSPEGYKGFVGEVHRGRTDGLVQPFTVIPERGIKDFAELYSIDDRPVAVKTMLQAVLLRADAMYRSELGAAIDGDSGRRVLQPLELARALSLTLGDRRENGIMQAAEKGQLSTKEQVAAHVQRILDGNRRRTASLSCDVSIPGSSPDWLPSSRTRPKDRARCWTIRCSSISVIRAKDITPASTNGRWC